MSGRVYNLRKGIKDRKEGASGGHRHLGENLKEVKEGSRTAVERLCHMDRRGGQAGSRVTGTAMGGDILGIHDVFKTLHQ